MPATLDDKARALLEAPNFCMVVTHGEGGRPLINPIWVHTEGDHINFLARKYLDKDEYPFRSPGEQRILFRIEPEKVHVYGG